MSSIRDRIAQVVLGAFGIVCGVLSGVALAIAAIVSAILGAIAFALAPLRALVERLRAPARPR